MNWRIPLADLDYGPEENLAVEKILNSRWLTMGSATQEFEESFANYLGAIHTIAVTNGTAALHLACIALELGPGDEVLVPSLTFVATANAIRYVGATPVFVDIVSQENLNISPADIERKITDKTRAILLVHFGGYACDMPEILEIAKKHDLKIIEDAAHAVVSELNGKKLGTWGDIGCFSFFSNKNLATGEGGMISTQDDALAERLKRLRSHGMTSMTWDRHKGHAFSYDVVDLGFNYRIDEIRAALGMAQLKKLARNNDQRRKLTNIYREALFDILPEVTVPFLDHPGISAAHLMPILLPSEELRQKFMEQMKIEGIQTSIHYPPIHKFTAYASITQENNSLPITDDVTSRIVTLPLFPGLSTEDVVSVVEACRKSLSYQLT